MTQLIEEIIDPGLLLLDPNNYRFQDTDSFVYAAEDRFHEDSVQKRAYNRIRQDEGILALKNSIIRNGYISVERIVVRPYSFSQSKKWLVIEGNRRLAAVKWILVDNDAGVSLDQSVIESIKNLPVIIAEQGMPDEIFRASLMGIRHVSGTKEWGGYQRSKLIVSLRDNFKLDITEIGERLGLQAQEVNRRYRAFKALQQMQEHEDYAMYVKPSMYPLFHEALSIPLLRAWFGWDDQANECTNAENQCHFYDLITPAEDEEAGGTIDPKVTTYAQVRELRNILSKPEAVRLLLDPARSLQDAIIASKQEEMSRLWASEVLSAIRSLEAMGIKDLKTISEEDISLLQKLANIVNERLKDHASLVKAG